MGFFSDAPLARPVMPSSKWTGSASKTQTRRKRIIIGNPLVLMAYNGGQAQSRYLDQDTGGTITGGLASLVRCVFRSTRSRRYSTRQRCEEISKKTLNASRSPGNLPGGNGAHSSVELLEKAPADTDAVLKELGSQPGGLSEAEAESRLKQVGTNEIAREKRQSALMRLLYNIKNPLVLLLLALGVLSYLTGDLRAMAVIFVMVVLGVVLRFFQEMRADNAAEKLKAMVSNTATLVRDGKEAEVSLKMLVPGDIIRLAAGDMAPADVRQYYQVHQDGGQL